MYAWTRSGSRQWWPGRSCSGPGLAVITKLLPIDGQLGVSPEARRLANLVSAPAAVGHCLIVDPKRDRSDFAGPTRMREIGFHLYACPGRTTPQQSQTRLSADGPM